MDVTDWDARYEERPLLWSAEPNLFLVGEVGAMPPGTALDLACGEGRNAVWLAERGWQVTGVDFSKVALQRAAEVAAERGVELALIHADLGEWSPPEGAFDLVCLLYLHLPEQELRRVLQRACSALAPGGTLLVVGHDRSNLEGGYGGPSDPAVLYTPEEIAAHLTGVAVEKAERVRRAVETDEGMRTAIDALVRARRPPA